MEDWDASLEGLSILLKHKNSPDDVMSILKKLNQHFGSKQFLIPESDDVILYLLTQYENSEEIVSEVLDLISNSNVIEDLSHRVVKRLRKFLENSADERQCKLLNIFNNAPIDCGSYFNSIILIQLFNKTESNKECERTFLSTATLINKWIHYSCIGQIEYSTYEAIFLRLLEYISKPFESLNIDVTASLVLTLTHILESSTDAMQYLKYHFEYVRTVASMIGKDPKLCSPALKMINTAIANLDDANVDKILKETSYLHEVKNILNTPCDAEPLELKKEVFFGLSNIAAGSRSHVHLFLQEKQLISRTIFYLKESPCPYTKKEIIWLLGNFSTTKPGVKFWTNEMLTNPGLFSAILDSLENKKCHSPLKEFLENVLDHADSFRPFTNDDDDTQPNPIAVRIFECGAIDKLKTLQSDSIMYNHFGEAFEAYLAQRRRQNTKRALQ